jgi:uncharacterized protein YbjT (DUF2867 family)
MKKFLVVGASGTVGSEIARSLREQGHAVRATTHRRENVGTREGVERVYLDVGTGEGIAQAFEGIDRAFLLAPPGYADHQKILSPLVAEAKRRGIEKVVLMSAMGANAADTPFRRVEIELEGSGLAYNIIRPNWFMQNFNTFWLAGIRDQGAIRLPAGTAKTSFIDARDIAAVAVRLLTTDDQVNRDFDLTGPAAITHDEVARVLGKALGRDVAYEDIDPDALRQGLLAAKLPADYVEFLIVILGFLEQGYAERTTTAVRDLLGREPIAFERYARDHRDAWTQAKAA